MGAADGVGRLTRDSQACASGMETRPPMTLPTTQLFWLGGDGGQGGLGGCGLEGRTGDRTGRARGLRAEGKGGKDGSKWLEGCPDGERRSGRDDAQLSGKVAGARGGGGEGPGGSTGLAQRTRSGVRRGVCPGDGGLGVTRERAAA